MGAAQEMLDTVPTSPPDRKWLGYLFIIGRLLLGYVIAVAAGAIIFAIIGDYALGAPNPHPRSLTEWMDATANTSMMLFLLGLIFAIPYTVIGMLVCRYLLPRSMAIFLAAGALCPGAAIFTMGVVLGDTFWFGPEMVKMIALTIPSGLAAAYLFGAIGLGYGFGRWRFG